MGLWRILLFLLVVVFIEIIESNRCLTKLEEVNPKRLVVFEGETINLRFEVSRRITQRLVTHVTKIFLEEVLGYKNVMIVEKDDDFNIHHVYERLSDTVTFEHKRVPPDTMVNMEVWILPQEDTMPLLNKYEVKECGAIAPPGHFSWFIPEKLYRMDDNWVSFTNRESAARFDVSESILLRIKNFTMNPNTKRYYCETSFCQNGMYIPRQCQAIGKQVQPCALLLAGHLDITSFVKEDIDSLNLYVKVAWVGSHLKELTDNLIEEYTWMDNRHKSLVIVHWTPSTVIPNAKDFVSINFPRCGTNNSQIGCEYESKRLVKVVWKGLEFAAKFAFESINRVQFTSSMYENLIDRYNKYSENVDEAKIACSWLVDNINHAMTHWMPKNADKNILYIGGIFPMSGTSYTAKSIVIAGKMAKDAINVNNSILRDYNLTLLASDGQCKTDVVMKSFIDYIVHNFYEKLVGVLGPACSETVEPLVGVARHYKSVIISYSAEGSSFNDRTRYPYFFRTIGENRQYKYVYLYLLQQLGWHRVASLTEDGQKYTEYISYMQDMLRDNGITFVANAKFPREWDPDIITKSLQDLKQKRAKIIIADVYDKVAREVMCEAYKLEMTAVQGYVWFLPLWLRSRWYDTDQYNEQGEQVPCTTIEMTKAINGHLSLSHAYFAPDDEIMQEGITVREWRDRYERMCKSRKLIPSNYAGYTYDAMWTYAYAIDRLLKENQSYVFDLHSEQTVNRLTNIISATDFYGVSGRIKFVGGPSRFSVINVVQYINNETHVTGKFYPNISETENEVIGGRLDLNISAFVWLSKTMPDDGSEPPPKCVFSGLAELLDVSCEVAIVIVNIIGFGLLGIVLITGFFIVKRKYDEKVRIHEKYMKSLGIDFSKLDTSSLDKWEIPRDRVVINRKIGEGAFGTVYGGEAFFPEKGWLAVAVKTLKVGSTIDEKSDFLSEFEVMKRFEHTNIIKLLGVCLKCEPVLTVMEFMLYGDLKTYLLARRHLVNDQSYEDSDEISNKKLTAMALDVARALSYLAQLKYVHRDVASRNCLINAQRVVKLGDFGMTRPMYENDYYRFNRKAGMLPVRWMAPESLGLGLFSAASDVWSYGVLLYEIITFGSFPFQGMSNNEVLAHVKVGNCLIVPKGVKAPLENLMYFCWSVNQNDRPSAPEIVEFLATNPRILSPCLDVPLASVQLEHTGQMEMHITDSVRKCSLPWSQNQQSPTQLSDTISSPNRTNSSLVEIDSHDDNQNVGFCTNRGVSGQDSTSPLLSFERSVKGLVVSRQNSNKQQKDTMHKYVNLLPGMVTSTRQLSKNGNAGNVQTEEMVSMMPTKTKESEEISIL
ncbi:PREDICTED: receptor-type guanylate cyclase gcy-4-like isoform X1 [Polistes canadensis]|uniref:receptor-type guanylate cyclase gcy-4-like isoform X1 n=1 Tax=Polistes canadensis TaxID=91411 RepID=UPI000718FF38|nr:PREDICTED: receptor-type guanylate cyclase gcy-4-like isoform X1 [Polistes canadensis]